VLTASTSLAKLVVVLIQGSIWRDFEDQQGCVAFLTLDKRARQRASAYLSDSLLAETNEQLPNMLARLGRDCR
jgi:hypothetical protein